MNSRKSHSAARHFIARDGAVYPPGKHQKSVSRCARRQSARTFFGVRVNIEVTLSHFDIHGYFGVMQIDRKIWKTVKQVFSHQSAYLH